MGAGSRSMKMELSSSISIADLASCYCAIMLALILLTSASFPDDFDHDHDHDHTAGISSSLMLGQHRPCDEIYVVGEGETLHTISDKCGDPFIVEKNPHIHDPDDVFPGLVIKITPHRSS